MKIKEVGKDYAEDLEDGKKVEDVEKNFKVVVDVKKFNQEKQKKSKPLETVDKFEVVKMVNDANKIEDYLALQKQNVKLALLSRLMLKERKEVTLDECCVVEDRGAESGKAEVKDIMEGSKDKIMEIGIFSEKQHDETKESSCCRRG